MRIWPIKEEQTVVFDTTLSVAAVNKDLYRFVLSNADEQVRDCSVSADSNDQT